MADDWDLYAVVRSCFNAAATSTASSSTTTDAAIAPVENSSLPSGETSLSSSFLASPSFQSGHTSSVFPGFANHTGDSFRGLEEIYKEPYEDVVQSFVDLNSQAQHIQAIRGPGCTADQAPQQQRMYGQPQAQQPMQQPQRYSHLSREMFVGSSLSFPSTSPQPERPRRRKNQQAKRIQQMTQEELSADSWAWRKYGQKPIKDSPYPRNYYRCSTSKGCTARKQVERCPADPSMYVVSYSGEHSHPRPTHRSSLAGTTRSKVPPAVTARPTITTTATTTSTTSIHNIASSSIASCSSSSPASASSFSPTATPITEGDSGVDENVDQETADNENNNSYGAELLFSGEEEVEGWADDGDGDDDDENDGDGNGDDDILIPNYALVNDDGFFKGLHFKD